MDCRITVAMYVATLLCTLATIEPSPLSEMLNKSARYKSRQVQMRPERDSRHNRPRARMLTRPRARSRDSECRSARRSLGETEEPPHTQGSPRNASVQMHEPTPKMIGVVSASTPPQFLKHTRSQQQREVRRFEMQQSTAERGYQSAPIEEMKSSCAVRTQENT